MPAVISDTSCLLFLGKINKPDLFEEVWITPTVASEYRLPLPAWIIVLADAPLPTPAQLLERFGLGKRASIGLALTQPGCLLILDDEQPKQLAKALGITCLGTPGVLKLAKEQGLIDQLRPRNSAAAYRTVGGMWLADYVAERVCREAGE